MLATSLVVFSLLVGTSFANNDWSQPCLSGVCQYDLPSNGSASGTLKIWGPDSAISDITPAAGWQIIDCSPSALEQDIRLVCTDASSNCTHLYSGSSDVNAAVGKVVRLPENCGQSAFAVVTKSWTPQDQSVPSVTPVNGTKPTVQALSLSTNFSSVKPSSSGPVNFVLQAANFPGAQADLPTTPQQQRRSNSRIFGRGVTDFVRDAVNGISSLNDFNVSKSTTLQPVDVDKSFNLVDKSISCPPVDASVKIDVDGKAHAVASIGIAASGTIVPPEVSDFSLIVGLNADIDGSLDLKASASGTLDSGKITLFSVGIPGLDFPGILTIGPSFEIDGQATATLDVDVDMTVGISYTVDNAQFTFPPKSSLSGSFNIGDTPLKLSANPSVTATGTVNAHLIPTLNFGISALDNAVSATVFVALDASATMTLTGDASADASATVNAKRDLGRLGSRGVYVLTPPELNARQFDDSDSDDGDDVDDGSEDDSVDDGETDFADDGEDDSADDGEGDSQDDSEDVDASADEGDGTQDNSHTADNGDDEGDTQDDSANTSDDDADSTVDDGTDGADDGQDTSVDAGNVNSQDNPADDSNATDDSSDASGDDSASTVDTSGDVGNGDDGSVDGDDSSDTSNNADAGDDADTPAADADGTSADNSADDTGDDSSTSTDTASNSTDTNSASSAASPDDSDPVADASSRGNVLASPSASATFGGCFSVDAALDVNAGANGNFFGLFDPSTKVDLFNKKFEIFKKCFGSSSTPAQRRSFPGGISHRRLLRGHSSPSLSPMHSRLAGRGFSLTCPSTAEGTNGTQQSVADETVPAAQITKE